MHKIIIIVMATKPNVEVIVKAIKVRRSAQGGGDIDSIYVVCFY